MDQVNTSVSEFSNTPFYSKRRGKEKLGIETERSVTWRWSMIFVFPKLSEVIFD